jgi:hypothetical protein
MNSISNRTLRLAPEGLSAEERKVMRKKLPTLICICGGAMLIHFLLVLQRDPSPSSLVRIAAVSVPWLFLVGYFMPRYWISKLRKLWATFELEIGPDYVQRRQADSKDFRLAFDEIRFLRYLPGKDLHIYGDKSWKLIEVPKEIEHFEEVREFFSRLAPTKSTSLNRGQKRSVLCAAGLGGWIVMLWSSSPILVLAASLALAALAAWVILYFLKTPNLTAASRLVAISFVPAFFFCLWNAARSAVVLVR